MESRKRWILLLQQAVGLNESVEFLEVIFDDVWESVNIPIDNLNIEVEAIQVSMTQESCTGQITRLNKGINNINNFLKGCDRQKQGNLIVTKEGGLLTHGILIIKVRKGKPVEADAKP